LTKLPEGFILWEHVKYKVDKFADEKKKEKGKHAAGAFERQDAYLYGHPQGRKKKYRSPADFFPHLLWLGTDPEGNHDNCSCKICSPDKEEETKNDTKNDITKEEVGKRMDNKYTPTVAPAAASVSAPKSMHTLIFNPTWLTSVSSGTASKSTLQTAPNFSGQVRSAEQKLDSESSGVYLYRPGELVWFNKGPNWGLGVISKRQVQNNKPRYLIQPLSHPVQHPPYQIKDQEDSIRPWLAWSVPEPTNPGLRNLTFDQVPWEQVIRGDFGRYDAEVDGSILAAKAIDASYSLFDRIENALVSPGEVSYNGIFLGAEKIWAGEPVRLRRGDDIVVLIIQKLIERTTPPATSIVTFLGDIYQFVEMPSPYKSRSEWPTPALPPRMVADLRFRNEIADAAKIFIWYEWRLLEPAAKVGLSDVKGRWYETRTLLPILRGVQQFQQDISHGTTTDAGLWMNGRGDNSAGQGQRKKNRKDTLGRSVPPDCKSTIHVFESPLYPLSDIVLSCKTWLSTWKSSGFTNSSTSPHPLLITLFFPFHITILTPRFPVKVSRGLDGNLTDDLFPDSLQSQKAAGFVEGDIEQFMDLDQDGTGQNDFYGGEMQH
jgi:hypothetical protein